MTENCKIRVFIKHSSAVARYLLTEAIDQEYDMEVVGTVQDNATALTRIVTLNPDVLLLDMQGSDPDELYATQRLIQNCTIPVLIITSLPATNNSSATEFIKIGAFDYIYRDLNLTWGGLLNITDELIYKIRKASATKKL